MSHSIRELAGKSWHEWPHTQLVEDMDALAPSPSTSSTTSTSATTPASSRSHSPKLPGFESDACMRLPKHDMRIFGQNPVMDDFVLVVCDLCHASVKVEAFSSHVRLRHAGHKQSSKYHTKACSVELLKEDIFSLSTRPTASTVPPLAVTSAPIKSGSSSPTPVIPVVPPILAKSPKPPPPPAAMVEVTAPPVPSLIEPMDIDIKEEVKENIVIKDEPMPEILAPPSHTPQGLPQTQSKVMEAPPIKIEENNVISIPDTEPLPHGMSNDLMAMMEESQPQQPQPPQPPGPNPANMPIIRLQVKAEPSGGNTPTEVVIQPPLSKKGISNTSSPIKISNSSSNSVGGNLVNIQPQTLGTSTSSNRVKPMREYNPDKHCGVWDGDTKRHCTRALTCKSHSVLLKRKIEGRSRPFDELVAAHKKAQAEAAAKAAAGVSSATTPIQVRPYTPTVSVTAPPSVASIRTPPPVVSAVTPSPTKDPNEESLYYTTDHPRPLAVCGFKGGRRVGGLIVTGRNHIFTRKLVRVAITAGTAASFGGGGFHRIRPRVFIGSGGATVATIESPSNAASPYVLNYNLSGNIKRAGGPGNGPAAGVVSVANAVTAGGNGGLNLTTLPPGGVVIPESFKTDIQDFKGGIKFELGRKIKHILPSGSEVSK